MVPDYGLDYTVQIFDEAGGTTPYSFHAQLKATDEAGLKKGLGSVRFDRDWAEHYWSLPLPVLVVRFHASSDRLFARWFHAYNPHVALKRKRETPTKTIGFRLSEADAWTESTSAGLEAAVRAFMQFRSPELELPLRFSVSSAQGDALRNVFALRATLAPVSDIVQVAAGSPGPDRPHIAIGERSSTVALGDVASVTLEYAEDVPRSATTDAANIATAVALALTRVGQSNLAAQVAAACAAASSTILAYDVAFSLAQAFYRARRTMEALKLADAVGDRDDPDARFAAFLLQTAVLARGSLLSSDESQLAIEVSRARLRRSEAREDELAAAGDAYNLGQALRRALDRQEAIAAYRKAAELDPTYDDRAYFNGELAGTLFENGDFEEAAKRYKRALELGADPLTEALLADALLWSGRYDDAEATLSRYLGNTDQMRDAEWRLKHRALNVIREMGTGRQARQPGQAAALIVPFDLESGKDWNAEDGLRANIEALQADACCAEAWFRLGFLTLGRTDPPDVSAAFEITLASAVLHRESPGAWNNTVRLVRAAHLPDDIARDCLHMAYRFCGPTIAQTLHESDSESDEAHDPNLFALLNEVMETVDPEETLQSFTLRLPDREGGMTEFPFVTGMEDVPLVVELRDGGPGVSVRRG